MNITDTATPERIALVHAIAAESQGAYSELCDTFRAEGMGNADADNAAWALWVRYLRGEFDNTAPADTEEEPEEAPATPEQLTIMRELDAADSDDMTALSKTFHADGMWPIDKWAAASKLWRRYLDGEFDNADPTVTVTLPAALRTILADTDALDGLAAVAVTRGALRITGTADQLTALTHDRLWAAADPATAEARERAAYRRWTTALERAGVRL
jgi:hypothetical protein